VTWGELFACAPEDFTLRTMPARFAAIGDRHAGIAASPGALDALLELSPLHVPSRIATICSSVKRDFRMCAPAISPGIY
jgi:DNA primase